MLSAEIVKHIFFDYAAVTLPAFSAFVPGIISAYADGGGAGEARG